MGETLIFSLNFDEFSVWIKQGYQIWIFDMALKAYKAVYIFSPVTENILYQGRK